MKKYLSLSLLLSILLVNVAHSARWWKVVEDSDGYQAIDLDSYRNYFGHDNLAITSLWVRTQSKKAQTIPHPITGKKFITSGSSLLIQAKCASGELKIADMVFEDRKFNALLTLSHYPELITQANKSNYDLPLGHFKYVRPDSKNANIFDMVCQLNSFLIENDLTPADLKLDEDGNLIPPNLEETPNNFTTDEIYDELEI